MMNPLFRVGGVIILISTYAVAQYDQYKAVFPDKAADKDPNTIESEEITDDDTNPADDKEKRPFGGIFAKPYNIGKRPFGSIFHQDYDIGKRPFGGAYGNSFKIGKRPFGGSYGNSFKFGKRPFGSSYSRSFKIGKRPFGGTYKSSFKIGKRPFGSSYRGSFKIGKRPFGGIYGSKFGKRPFSTYGGSFGMGKRPFGTYGDSFDIGKRALTERFVEIGETKNEPINPGPGFTFESLPENDNNPELAQILTNEKPYISLDDLADVIIIDADDIAEYDDNDDDDDDEDSLVAQKRPFTLGGGPFSSGKRSTLGFTVKKRPFTFWYPYKLGKRLDSPDNHALVDKLPFVLRNFRKRPFMTTMSRFNIGKRTTDANEFRRKRPFVLGNFGKRPFTTSNGFNIGKRPFVLGGFEMGKRPFVLGSFKVGKRPFVLGGFKVGSFGKRDVNGSQDENDIHDDSDVIKRPFGGTYGGSYKIDK